MKFKVFTANTIQEAMAQVKSELGMDAVILHTRRFNKGGIFGYLGKEMVEVMAAIDDKQQEKVKLPKEELDEYTRRYCANEEWRRCPIARALTLHYERTENR